MPAIKGFAGMARSYINMCGKLKGKPFYIKWSGK